TANTAAPSAAWPAASASVRRPSTGSSKRSRRRAKTGSRSASSGTRARRALRAWTSSSSAAWSMSAADGVRARLRVPVCRRPESPAGRPSTRRQQVHLLAPRARGLLLLRLGLAEVVADVFVEALERVGQGDDRHGRLAVVFFLVRLQGVDLLVQPGDVGRVGLEEFARREHVADFPASRKSFARFAKPVLHL